ncbi:sigma 54-interacting transcriptional regulator [Erwinia sp. 198]|uniref:sigma 54-interacting transcriptional regulator n=1 Tax=Erwinia sp. 198 TaxID=2022746 RepID=UPI000F67CE3A|nr:sigma 54-interacting transcriptional regulator [Erwinia sp. 198]RRZ92982.1 PRD domain-containing protein [Erwinia sp. 198]
MTLSAKEKLYQTIARHSFAKGFTALECSKLLPLSRSVISHYLNRLCEEGRLRKEPGRPVRFFITVGQAMPEASKDDDAFSQLIGVKGSLAEAVELCRSAVNYPGQGLPILLTGESGVGKSHLASLIHRYAVQQGLVAPEKPLFELNCADYANNPELLSATLFGYSKGAFTGADREKPGLLDEADGSYLFLDEVHRLPASGQEKLFLFLDKGYFYRLGDSKTRRPATIRFIFATTENIDTALLNTFRRRIPMRVVLPNFISRPLAERVAQVEYFLHCEACRLERDIYLDSQLMRQLVMSPIKGNVGELKNQLKVICASAWNQSRTDRLELRASRRARGDSEKIVIPARTAATGFAAAALLPKALWDEIIFREFCHSGNILLLIRKVEQLLTRLYGDIRPEALYCGYLWQAVRRAVDELENNTGVCCSPSQRKAIWLCLCYAMHHAWPEQRIEELTASTDWLSVKAKLLALECAARLKAEGVEERYPLLLPLLGCILHKLAGEDDLIHGIIVAHGRATASSLAGIANQLCGGYYLTAFDMPWSTSTGDIIEMLIAHLTIVKQSAGLIILVDMGSLKEIYQQIKRHLHGELLVINNVSTAMALDIASGIQNRLSMADLIAGVKGAYEAEARYYAGVMPGNKIIISCISGEGISGKLSDILRRYLADGIALLTLDYDDLKHKIQQQDPALHGTRLIITTTPLEAGFIPLLGVEKLIKEKAEVLERDYFANLLAADSLQPVLEEIVKMFTVDGVAERLNFLNPAVVIEEIAAVIQQYEAFYQLRFASYLRVNLFMHIALMIERVMLNSGMNHRDDAPLSAAQQAFVTLHETFFQALNRKYRLALPLTEVLMIYEIMEPWIAGEAASTLS